MNGDDVEIEHEVPCGWGGGTTTVVTFVPLRVMREFLKAIEEPDP
jgi:hypothetical protein